MEKKEMKVLAMKEQVTKMIERYVKEYAPTENFNVYEVWHCYILGNEKWLMATTLQDGMYYEVTYNKAKGEFYLDAYKKSENICYSKEQIDRL